MLGQGPKTGVRTTSRSCREGSWPRRLIRLTTQVLLAKKKDNAHVRIEPRARRNGNLSREALIQAAGTLLSGELTALVAGKRCCLTGSAFGGECPCLDELRPPGAAPLRPFVLSLFIAVWIIAWATESSEDTASQVPLAYSGTRGLSLLSSHFSRNNQTCCPSSPNNNVTTSLFQDTTARDWWQIQGGER